MNHFTKVKLIHELKAREAWLGAAPAVWWRSQYWDSAWVYLGGLPARLTEGDVLCMFSPFGEVVSIHLVRDHKSGRSRGFGFLCYADQRSTVLAVDNLNGTTVKGRTIRVDHVSRPRAPKDSGEVGM